MQQTTTAPEPRKGMPDPYISRETFKRRFKSQYIDKAFDDLEEALESMADAAWQAYDAGRKAPRTVKAGPGYADPDYDLAVDWVEVKAAVDDARERHAVTGSSQACALG